MHFAALHATASTASHTTAIVILLVLGALAALITMRAAPTPFRTRGKGRGRDPSNRAVVPDVAATLTVSSLKLRVTVPMNYSMNGIPHVGATGGAHSGTEYPTAVTPVSQTVFDLTYAHNVAAGDAITYPDHDPAARFNNGAYIQAQNKTL